MNNKFIDYQGSKMDLSSFILDSISPFLNKNSTVLDIFAGSAAVSSVLNEKYNVYANDVELYSSTINAAILNPPKLNLLDMKDIDSKFVEYKKLLIQEEDIEEDIILEKEYINGKNQKEVIELYNNFKTVWNTSIFTPNSLRKLNKFNLFLRYYSGTYFGIEQSVEIDVLIKIIHESDDEYTDILYACLFYAMNQTVFSRDGHMAQPLDFNKNSTRGFKVRDKNVYDLFIKKLVEQIITNSQRRKLNSEEKNKVFNCDFKDLLEENIIKNNVDLIYADPPYTDMQYSRYYHLLKIARDYDFPNLSLYRGKYTKGLYTEGRFQSDLSKRSKATEDIKYLVEFCYNNNIDLALSYAYPDLPDIANNRYTLSISDLIEICESVFDRTNVKVNSIRYAHSNHKNKTHKPILEYVIVCSKKKSREKNINLSNIKSKILTTKPTNRDLIYNTHLYWSQKSYNIIDILINNLTQKGDIVFDPFMGSGVSVLEAVKTKTKRNAIGIDLNEMPVFITKSILDYSFTDNLKEALNKFIKRITTLEHYYRTDCPKCGQIGILERVVFDKLERNNKNSIQIKSIQGYCKTCKKFTITDNHEMFKVIKDDMNKSYEYKIIDKNFPLLRNSRIAVIENDSITNIFTNRNLKVIDEILILANSLRPSENKIIKYVLMSIMHQLKITDARSNSQWPLWIPKKDAHERNVILLFEKKLKNYIKSIDEIKDRYNEQTIVNSFLDLKESNALILTKPSQSITRDEVPDDSVDLIITDPPYLGQVLYSEYMQLYAPILGFEFNLEDEIVLSSGQNRNKDLDDYYKLLFEVFNLSANKLKKNKFMCMYFHENSLNMWNDMMKVLYEIGFDYVGQVHITKSNTLKNIISPKKSLKGDLLLFFKNSKQKRIYKAGPESIEEIENNLYLEAKHMIIAKNEVTTSELIDNGLMEIIIQNGWLEIMSKKYNSIIDFLGKYFKWDQELAIWKLKSSN